MHILSTKVLFLINSSFKFISLIEVCTLLLIYFFIVSSFSLNNSKIYLDEFFDILSILLFMKFIDFKSVLYNSSTLLFIFSHINCEIFFDRLILFSNIILYMYSLPLSFKNSFKLNVITSLIFFLRSLFIMTLIIESSFINSFS
ncbi:hypothetical protein CNEONATC25_02037 [Clostridium neonatale]|nr:hypothetical protein CNEONATC25_02037 [Clostridium neonatale]